jgi:hypothetical protein
MHALAVCSACGEPLDPREVRPEPGPGWIAPEEADEHDA